MNTKSPVTALPGIGPARARKLREAGVETVGDLLLHLPGRYEDRRAVRTVAEARAHIEAAGSEAASFAATFRGHLHGVRAIRTRRRGFSLVRGKLVDETGELPVVWFNRPYLAKQVVEGATYLLHGEVKTNRQGRRELTNPSVERVEDPDAPGVHGARVTPVYPALGELGPALVRRLLDDTLGLLDPAAVVPEPLPPDLLERHGLPPLGEALARLHRPAPDLTDAQVEALLTFSSPEHQRLVYGELLRLQLELACFRRHRESVRPTHPVRVDDGVRAVAREVLPFKLTGAQRRVAREIVDDLRAARPMLRLLQGDVGSGKTVVAALALVVALENGLQGAFMAPTELLAEQHFRTLQKLLGHRYRVVLLTGSTVGREEHARALSRGYYHLAVGTHALIQEGVRFAKLGLAVIDEQHRFGVLQRQRLVAQPGARQPHVLVMTATPIPRSLALTVYGDLDLSVVDELPPGRQPVRTEVLPLGRKARAVEALRRELAAGGRAYAVYPLIEESEQVGAASVEEEGEALRRALAEFPSAVLTGRTPADERDEIMASFARGDVRFLVSTTVIEVGVDVPEATVMWIESAERFGLSQLHQLRGRVGRGSRASTCVVLHGTLTDDGRRRLEVFGRTTDGFEISEADLEIRGPGDVLGTRQAGLPTLRAANLLRDRRWLGHARDDARALLERWDAPECAALRRIVEPRVARRVRELEGEA